MKPSGAATAQDAFKCLSTVITFLEQRTGAAPGELVPGGYGYGAYED